MALTGDKLYFYINASFLLHTQNPSVDLNRRPSAPRNVVFDVVERNRDTLFIGAQWEMFLCESNFTCVELLGYVIICRDEDTMKEVRKTVWLSDYQDDEEVFANARIEVNYFTRYDCAIASQNTYGVGQPGSKVAVTTPETSASLSFISAVQHKLLLCDLISMQFLFNAVPKKSASQLYVSSIDSTRGEFHWTYEETPKPGTLLGFAVYIYRQNPRFPDREGTHKIEDFVDTSVTNQDQTSFSHTLTYLDPGVAYNVFIAAATVMGKGPRARLSIRTLREGM